MDTMNIITTFLVLTLLLEFVIAQERKEETFHVKPGAGTLSVETEVGEHKCKFTYAAQGGTHEEWAFSMEMVDGGAAVMCVVERGVSSYIFFEHFKMELTGPLVAITDVDLKASQRDNKDLQSLEYTKGSNQVSSSAQFKNQLEKVAVYSPLQRVDL